MPACAGAVRTLPLCSRGAARRVAYIDAMRIIRGLLLSSLLALAAACAPSINQAAKADVDARVAAMAPSGRAFEAPAAAEPMPLAVGQWATIKTVDKDGRPSITTYKIVGADGDALWFETHTDSYFGSSVIRMLVAFGDRTDPAAIDVRAVWTRDTNGVVQELPPPLMAMMKGTFEPVLRQLVLRWDALPQEDADAIAGRFEGCFRGQSTVAVAGQSTTSEVWWHPAVPVISVVKAVGVSEPSTTELVDFGYDGATSSF